MGTPEIVEKILHISEKPWSDYTEADYSIEQWHAACLIHLHDGAPTSKSECKLPVKTPNGALNRNGVHAAAAALAGARSPLKASPEQKSKAAASLRRLYSQLDETPPDSLKQSEIVEDILAHFGVKGMKWGQRRALAKAAKGEKKFEKRVTNPKKQIALRVELHNATAKAMNEHHIPRINNKPEYIKAANNRTLLDESHPTTKKYLREFEDAYISELNKEAAKMTSPSGRSYEAHRSTNDFLGFNVSIREKNVKHADDKSFRVNFIKDKQGRIIGLEFIEGSITQSVTVDDILAHFGVKGQKWGVRRKATVGAQEVIVSDKRIGKGIKTKGGRGHPATPEAVRSRTIGQVGKKSGLKALSNKQLEEYNRRLNLEQNTKRLMFESSSPPRKFILRLLGQTGKQQASEAANAVASKQVKRALAKAALA